MTNDLRAAAERLRRIYAGESYQSVYGVEWIGGGFQQRDEQDIVEHFLATTRPDDGEEPTADWLRQVGFQSCIVFDRLEIPARFKDGNPVVWLWHDPDGEIGWSSEESGAALLFPAGSVWTRGQLRDLCRALQIELKE